MPLGQRIAHVTPERRRRNRDLRGKLAVGARNDPEGGSGEDLCPSLPRGRGYLAKDGGETPQAVLPTLEGLRRRLRLAATSRAQVSIPELAVLKLREGERSPSEKLAGILAPDMNAAERRSAIGGPCLSPWPDPPPTIQTLGCSGCGAAMRCVSTVIS